MFVGRYSAQQAPSLTVVFFSTPARLVLSSTAPFVTTCTPTATRGFRVLCFVCGRDWKRCRCGTFSSRGCKGRAHIDQVKLVPTKLA